MTSSAPHHRLLLIIGGGIAAYKCLELIRRTRERGIAVRVIMTAAAREFVTPLSVSALTNDRVFTDLFDLDDEREIGHIRLARQSDLVVVALLAAIVFAFRNRYARVFTDAHLQEFCEQLDGIRAAGCIDRKSVV